MAGDLTEAARIEAKDLFARWQGCLDALRRDPLELADQLDWVAKLKLMNSYRERDGLGWDAAKMALIDLQYCDVDPRRSLYQKLVAKGRMQRLISDAEIEQARTEPPSDTRAYFRGKVMRKFGDAVVAASWDSVIFDVPGRAALQRIPLLDPLRGTKAQVGQLIDSCDRGRPLPAPGPVVTTPLLFFFFFFFFFFFSAPSCRLPHQFSGSCDMSVGGFAWRDGSTPFSV